MGIRLKLILFLLLFGFIILGALLWSNQFVLHKTMLHYIDQRDQQRLDRLKNNLEAYLDYELISNVREVPPMIWERLVHISHRIDLLQNHAVIPIVINKKPPRRPKPPDEFETRVTLADENGELVYGANSYKTFTRMPIKIDGKVIGHIGYHPLQGLMEKTDIEFANSQFKLLSFGAVLITLLALVLLWPLANHFLVPIRQLTKAMHALASGDLKQRLNTKRQDELGELQRDFNHLATTLEAAQKSRNQWVADISHELRTPLTVINGSIEAMSDGVRPLNGDNLQKVQQEVGLLMRLIEDLYQLSLSDVGALQYRMQPLDFAELVNQACEQFKVKAEAKKLNLTCEVAVQHAWLEGDTERLMQMLSNLLQNAIHYTDALTPQGDRGLIEINLQKQADHLFLTIEDTAPGVDVAELESLSTRFYRSEGSRNRSTGGAGLGLSIVTQIVKAHQGLIDFIQSEQGGLKVMVKLPVYAKGKSS